MKSTLSNSPSSLVIVAASIVLSACGGGGDNASPTPPSSTVEAYAGTWLSDSCEQFSGVTQTLGGNPVSARLKQTLTFSKLDATTLNTKVVYTFYAGADLTCTGTPILTLTKTGDNTGNYSQSGSAAISSQGNNTATIVADVTVGTQAAQQIRYSESSLQGSSISNGTLSFINGVSVDSAKVGKFTDNYLAKVVGNQLTFAFDASTGNPFASTFTLGGSVSIYTYTKQP